MTPIAFAACFAELEKIATLFSTGAHATLATMGGKKKLIRKKATIEKPVLPEEETAGVGASRDPADPRMNPLGIAKIKAAQVSPAKMGQLVNYGTRKSTSTPLKSWRHFTAAGTKKPRGLFGSSSPTKAWRVGVGSPKKGYIPGKGGK